MFKKTIIIVVLLSACMLFAMEPTREAIGLHGGISTSSGLSFKIPAGKGVAQVTTFLRFTGKADDEDNEPYSRVNIGFNYLSPLFEYSLSRFYIIVGGAYSYRSKKHYYSQQWDEKHYAAFGVGPGFEFIPIKGFPELRLNLELPLTYDTDRHLESIIPSGGLYYHF